MLSNILLFGVLLVNPQSGEEQDPFAIRLNDGAGLTNRRRIEITIQADPMKFFPVEVSMSVGEGEWSAWIAYSARMAFELPEGDQSRTIRVKLRDAQGKECGPVEASITLDTQPPFACISYPAASRDRMITLKSDTPDAVAMQFAEDPSPPGEWQPFVSPWLIKLSANGHVLVRYRDAAGNIGEFLDVSVKIDSSAFLDGSTLAGVVLDAREGDDGRLILTLNTHGTDLVEMEFNLDGVPVVERGPYSAIRALVVDRRAGIRRIDGMYRDAAGSEFRAVIVFQEDDALRRTLQAKSVPSPWSITVALGGLYIFEGVESNTVNGRRELDPGLAAALRLTASYELTADWCAEFTAELAEGSRASVQTFGLGLRYHLLGNSGAADAVRFCAGPALVMSQVSFADSDFGDFDSAIGFEVRTILESPLFGVPVRIGMDWRFIQYPWAEDILSGDEELNGGGLVLSIGVTHRF